MLWSRAVAFSLGSRRATAAVLFVVLSWSAHADYVYGPPYDYNTAYGTEGGFTSVDAAVNSLISNYETACTTYLTCKPHTFSTVYGNTGTAATITISHVNDDGSSSSDLFGYIWATDVTGSGFQPKNAGGCRSGCTDGNGSLQDSIGPAGSSGNGTTKRDTDRGTSLEGDPINAANGNEYRQDTDVSTSPWLTFRRFYNSSSFVSATTMGPKWRHSFDRTIDLMPGSGADGGLLYARRPDGSLIRFTSSKGVWKADNDSAQTLSVAADPVTGVRTGYSLRMASTKATEIYDANGRLLDITDDNGWVTALTYSDASTSTSIAPKAGLLIAVTDPQGRVLNLRYDAKGRLSQVIDPAGQTVGYTYADSGNLGQVMFADGTSRQYLYSETDYAASPTTYPAELTGVIDEKGVRYETTTFSSSNHAISNQFAGGADKIALDYYNYYQNGGTPADLTTPLGLVLTLGFADDGAQTLKPSGTGKYCGNQCNQTAKAITYDANGYPATQTDYKGTVTSTTYDANGLLTHEVQASATDAERTTTTTWDVTHRHPLTQATANAKGVVVSKNTWAYNARGQVTAECAVDPAVTTAYTCGSQAHAPNGIRQTRYAYCDAVDAVTCPEVGLLLTTDGPRTDVTDTISRSYYLTTDESGCATVGGACHRAGDLSQLTNAAGHVTTVLAYDRHGRPVRRKDPNGVIIDVSYTPRGWLASRTVRANADGSASTEDATTTLTYDAVGALKTVIDADGVTITYAYDDAHRLVDVADGAGNHIHYTLDPSGNRTKEETFDKGGTSRRVLSRKFNNLGQLVSVTDGMGHVAFDATASASFDANGNLVAAKDALGLLRQDTYDALDRLVTSVSNANGADAATKATTTALAFDALDQLKSITDPDGLVTTYAFDGLRNPTGQVSPDTGTQTATFDAFGNPVTQTDAKGNRATQAFDALNRKVSTSFTDAKLNIAYHYDEANSVTGCSASSPVGRLTRIVETAVTTVYCYDKQGRVTQLRQTQGTTDDTTDYVYTKAGRLAAVASPSGLVTEYTRDTLGEITAVRVTPYQGVATSVVDSATYLPFGPLSSYSLGNGQTVTRTYNANYQATDVVSPALNLHFARDAAGNIVGLGSSAGASPADETYTYDPLSRLTSVKDASGTAIEAYTYNRTGDRLSKSAPGVATGTYGYTSGSHWLTSIGTAARAYDANGSTTANASAGVAWGYGYNDRGQLTVVQQGGATAATYGYNWLEQRVSKTVGAAQTRFTYGTGLQLLGEYGTSPRDYIWMDTVPVGVVDNGVVTYIHADALDTPRATANAAGATTWSWAANANPFGEAEPKSLGYHLSLRFPGQYADDESHLIYNNYRYYDPAAGRYLESDPIGLDGGTSTYGYAFQDPLDTNDPLGLAPPGHHEFPQSIWKGVKNLSNDARTLFRDAVIDPANRHGWSKQHAAYNRIARRAWDKFCESTKADVETMSKETAEGFMDFLREHPEVARFNAQIKSGEELTMPDETAPINEPPPLVEPSPPQVAPTELTPVKVEDPVIIELFIP